MSNRRFWYALDLVMAAPDDDAASAQAPRGPLDGTQYVAKRLLGRGSMGAVYLSEHRGLGTKVVVKVLHAELARQPDVVERMRIEAQAQAKLRSPYILACSDFGVNAHGAPYLVTAYLEGRTLKDEIDARGTLPVDEAVALAVELLKGLAVAHDAGIVHRDVKPPNLFVAATAAGRTLKILDFGIAKVLAHRTDDAPAPSPFPTAEGMMIGTPRFCSPEQALAKPVDHRSDLYSASLVLYAMLTGRGPFDDKRTMAELLLAQAMQRPAAPSTFAAHVPAALDAVVLKALEKAPADRYATAAEFVAALEAVKGEPAQGALPEASAERLPAEHDDTERDAQPAHVIEVPAAPARAKSAADDPTLTATPAVIPDRHAARANAPVAPEPAPKTVRLRDTVPLRAPPPMELFAAGRRSPVPVEPAAMRARGLSASVILAAVAAVLVALIVVLLLLLLG